MSHNYLIMMLYSATLLVGAGCLAAANPLSSQSSSIEPEQVGLREYLPPPHANSLQQTHPPTSPHVGSLYYPQQYLLSVLAAAEGSHGTGGPRCGCDQLDYRSLNQDNSLDQVVLFWAGGNAFYYWHPSRVIRCIANSQLAWRGNDLLLCCPR